MTLNTLPKAPVWVLLGTALAFAASAVFAQNGGAPNTAAIDRTDAEAARVADVTAPTTDFTQPEPFEARPAGAASLMEAPNARAFSAPSANMPPEQKLNFTLGAALFERLWVTAPATTLASDGLGPLYNARACISCHLGNGRGHPPEGPQDSGVSMVLRLSIPDAASDLPPEALARLPNAPEPTYGLQLQDKSIAGLPAEGRMTLSYDEIPVTLGDGRVVTLRKPHYGLTGLGYGPMHPDTQVSPRVAPPMIGLGLLEAIPEADILAHADPDDSDGDGISGRANIVWPPAFDQPVLGRFGLKAGSPSVLAQSMDALNADIGLSNPLRPAAWGDCTPRQTACLAAPTGNTPAHGNLEASQTVMELLTLYSRNLAVPQRRAMDAPDVLQGKALFQSAGCAACHVPKFVTHRLPDQPEQSFQLIWPYSDLLLHDMGEGLADNRREWQANGQEWRTPPLWGLGLTELVGGQQTYLHDGRARSLLEAILWHGGEAQIARDTVRTMDQTDRDALIAFLESL